MDSIYPSKPNTCRYRLSSLVFVFSFSFLSLLLHFYCPFVVAFFWFGFPFFARAPFWNTVEIRTKKNPLQNPHKVPFIFYEVGGAGVIRKLHDPPRN